MFALVLTSCPHKKEPGTNKKPLPPANPILKGTKWNDANEQDIVFSDSVALATITGQSKERGVVLEAPYEVKDEKIIISLDDFIQKLENFGEKEYAEFFKRQVVYESIEKLKDEIENPSTPDEAKAKYQARLKKLESGLGYLTSKAGVKKYMIECLIPVEIETLEEGIADTSIPDKDKESMKNDLAQMKEALANPLILDEMIEAEFIHVKLMAKEGIPEVKASNPITLKCEEGKTLESANKLISSACTINVGLPPIIIMDNTNFIKQ